jgi:hypothetical protein
MLSVTPGMSRSSFRIASRPTQWRRGVDWAGQRLDQPEKNILPANPPARSAYLRCIFVAWAESGVGSRWINYLSLCFINDLKYCRREVSLRVASA